MVAWRATRTEMPCFRASAAVCSPIHTPVTRERLAPSPTEDTKPLTVEALVKVTRVSRASTRSRSSSDRGFSYRVS